MKTNTYTPSIPDGGAFFMTRRTGLIVFLAVVTAMILSMGHAWAGDPIEKGSSDHDSLAVFDEVEADFGETEASFDDGPAATEPVTGNTTGGFSLFTAPDPARLSHSEHYAASRFFPDRQPRTVTGIRHAWLIPLALILGMVPLVVKQGGRPPKKHAGGMETGHFKTANVSALGRKLSLLILASCLGLFWASPSQALVYSPVKEAVVKVLGKDQKIFQTEITITPEAEAYLKKKLNWSPDKKNYKVYYSKTADGKPQRYAFVLSDKLEACGGLHKYCIAVNADGTVYDVSILELTCDRSYCINTRSFLSQFKGFNTHNYAQKAKAYDAMSGATLSTNLTRDIVQRALALMSIMTGQDHE